MAELRIESVMTRNPITVSGNTLLSETQAIMVTRGLRHLPVIEDGIVAGVVSDRDILLAQLAHEGLDNRDVLTVSDISTLSVFAVTPQSALADVADEMARQHIGSALVMEGDALVGIFTATDACRQLTRVLRSKS